MILSKNFDLFIARTVAVTGLAFGVVCFTVGTARADSCWDHNGSVMRLVSNDDKRTFIYEKPRDVLRAAGVKEGTVLFEGTSVGGWFTGSTKLFSKFCPTKPLQYFVEGPVHPSGTRVLLRGSHFVQKRCVPTKKKFYDNLEFNYSHKC